MKGGAKLEKVLYTMAAKLKSAKVVKVGFLEGAAYPSGIPVAAVAAFQDFGTRRIPPRPFFRNMISTKSPGWPKAIATTLKSTGYDAKKTLELSLREAVRLKHDRISSGHILLGVLREGEGVAALVLANAGVDLADLREDVTRRISSEAA